MADLFAPFKIPSLISPFSGYGSLIPTGVSGGSSPGLPGSTGAGYSSFFPTGGAGGAGGAGGVTPWRPPGAMAGPQQPMMQPGGMMPPGSAPGQPMAPGAGGGVQPGNGWLQQLIGGAQSNTQLPPLPDFGIKDQATLNQLNYNHYLQNQANAENDRGYNTALQATAGQGQSAKTDANQIAAKQEAANKQSLVSSGLNNTTVGATLDAGVNRELQRSLSGIDESTARLLIQVLQSRTVNGPNGNALADLLRAAGNQASPALYPNQNTVTYR